MAQYGFNRNATGRINAPRQINIKMDETMFEFIQEMAEKDDRSLASMVRILIVAGIEARYGDK